LRKREAIEYETGVKDKGNRREQRERERMEMGECVVVVAVVWAAGRVVKSRLRTVQRLKSNRAQQQQTKCVTLCP
jgi:hypothetical protein